MDIVDFLNKILFLVKELYHEPLVMKEQSLEPLLHSEIYLQIKNHQLIGIFQVIQ